MSVVYPAFKINGVSIPDPTKHKWINQTQRGNNGEGETRYNPFLGYEFRWNYLTPSEFYGLLNIWHGHYGSGSATFQVPMYETGTYSYKIYTGVYMDKPEVGEYYQNFFNDVKVVIRKVGYVR